MADGDRAPRQYRAALDGEGRSTIELLVGPDAAAAGGALGVRDLWRLPAREAPLLADSGPALDVGVPPGGTRAFVSTFRRAYDSGLHRTRTLDLSTVLAGSVVFCTETDEVELHAGDSVVVPGVLHGWRARGGAGQLLVVMLG